MRVPIITEPHRQRAANFLTYALLALVAMAFILPLVWMASVGLKPMDEVLSYPPTLLPKHPQTDAFREVFASEAFNFPLYARNTLIIALLSLVGMVLSSAIAAYGFARVPFRGRGAMFGLCLATMMIPFPVTMVPTYMLFKELGWIGTLAPLWVPAWFTSAFNVFLLRQFFMGIPLELEESARLDGCSRWGCFWRVILPLSKPALAVVALFHFLTVWNDLIGPLIYLSHQDQFTLSLGLQFLQSKAGDTPWNQLMAASLMVVLPVIVLFFLAQRTFIQGITTTGLKG
jgi:multiple sugar transport system permease protein